MSDFMTNNWNKCPRCLKPRLTCYCEDLSPRDSRPPVVILMHPHERKYRIGTGRMTHLALKNSIVFEGTDFTQHSELNAILRNPALSPMLLFPGGEPLEAGAANAAPTGRVPVLIVIDATWNLAKKILHRSPNLRDLRRISLSPSSPSQFTARRQPRADCLCTAEAISEVLEAFGDGESARSLKHGLTSMMAKHDAQFGRGPRRVKLHSTASANPATTRAQSLSPRT